MKLFYREFGQGEPLLILHGLFGSCDNWNSLAKQFGEDYHVFVIDQRNHGLSEHSSEWNYEVMAKDIADFCEQHNLQKINLLGHSMGGKVSMFFSQKYAHLLNKLIVVDISPRYYPPHHHAVLDALQSILPERYESRKLIEEEFNKTTLDFGTKQFLLKNIYWKENADGTKQMAWRFNLPVIVENIENVGQALPDAEPFLGDTVFISGEKSKYITDVDFESINTHFPKAFVKTIADANHWVQAEKPKEFYEMTMDFMRA